MSDETILDAFRHSEVDDPTTTHPVLYQKIEALSLLWKSYAETIGTDARKVDELAERVRREFAKEQEHAKTMKARPILREFPSYWSEYKGGSYDPALEVDTGVAPELLREISERIATVPENFDSHPKVKRGLEQRREMGRGERSVDWGMAEALALGSLLWEGAPVRLSGQDSRRGTFNQRHAVLFDVKTEEEYTPLQHLHAAQGAFECYDTPLSEASALGYEYGFSRDYPEALVLWETQFGDFVNGAQVIIDQFVSATEDKWGLLSGLVITFPWNR